MSNKILLIVPTKRRPQKHLEFYESFKTNSTITDLIFVLSAGDVEYPKIPGVHYEVVDKPTMSDKLNTIAIKYANDYDYLSFMGDDVRIRTNGWDVKMIEQISSIKNSIAYGNDLFMGEQLPTAVLLDSNIVKTLGFMSPPEMKHLYLDDFWKKLGEKLSTLKYFPEIILEHLHFINGKSEKDDTYRETDSMQLYSEDLFAFNNYVNNNLDNDIKKLTN